MRRLAQVFPVLCTLVLLGLGLNLPRLTSALLDGRLEREVVRREDVHASLALSGDTDFFQTLELFASSHSQVSLEAGYGMTGQQAQAAALDVIQELALNGRVYVAPEVTPMLLTSTDTPGLSGVFWRCVWGGGAGPHETLWLDDQSGNLVALQGRVGPPAYIATVKSPFPEEAVYLASYCQTHYDADVISMDVVDVSRGDYTIVLLRDSGAEQSVSLRLRGEWVYFNV